MFSANRSLSAAVIAAGGLVFAFGCEASADKESSAPAATAPAVAAAAAASTAGKKDIVDTAVAAGSFKTLATALEAAGLVDTLKGPGPFTVFAPTDAAFARLPAGTVESLLKPENKEKLTAVLTAHVVPAKAMSTDLKDGQTVKTVGGKELTLKIDGGKVSVAGANVTKPDIAASNGVIHVIDAVILP